MKDKLSGACKDLSGYDEKLIEYHGTGILDGYTHQPLVGRQNNGSHSLIKKQW